MSYATFLADPRRRDIFLVELYPWDVDADATETLYYSSDQYVTLPSDTPSNQVYTPVVLGPLNREASTDIPGTFAVLSDLSAGEIRLGNNGGELDGLKDYAWNGRRVVVKHLGVFGNGSRLDYADAGILFDGEAMTALVGTDQVTIYLREPEERFADPITTRVFRGTRYCLQFDGANTVVDFSNPAKLDLTGAMCLEGWFYFESASTAYDVAGWFGGSARPFTFTVNGSGKLILADSGSFSLTSTASITAKRWLHIAWVVESATAATLYVYDAVADTETVETFTGTGYTSRAAQSGAKVWIGYSSNHLDGLVDDVRVWNDARTASEIRGARHRPLTSSEDGDSSLVLYSKFDDGTGATATDSSGSPSNGAITDPGSDKWVWAMEGDEGLAGTPKPDAWGSCENVPLVYVDLPNETYLVCATQANAISTVYEGAYEGLTGGTAYTDFRTFLSSTTTSGQYDTLIYEGGTYIRLGASATLPMTADIEGDASGSGYVSTVGTIVRRIVTGRGADPLSDPSEIDTTSFTAIDTANSSTVGIYTDGTQSIAEVVNELLASIGAVGYFNRTDRKFHVERFEGVSGSSVLTLDSANVVSIEPLDTALPVWLGTLGYRKNFRVTEDGEFSGSATGERRLFASKEFRTTEFRDEGTLEDHPRALRADWPTLLITEAAAQAEAARRGALFGSAREAWRIKANTEGTQVDRLDVVTLDYEDLTALGVLQQRFGYASGGKTFAVLGFGEVLEDGTTMLEVWG